MEKLDAKFQYSKALALIENIINAQGDILAVIVNGNRVNQKFFKKFARETLVGSPEELGQGCLFVLRFCASYQMRSKQLDNRIEPERSRHD